MTVNRCQRCGTAFYVEPDEGWKKLCIDCWKRTKRAETRAPAWVPVDPSRALLEAANATLSAENFRLRAERAQAQQELDPTMLKLLVQLVHPDKHGGSTAANRAAVYLNNLRSRANR